MRKKATATTKPTATKTILSIWFVFFIVFLNDSVINVFRIVYGIYVDVFYVTDLSIFFYITLFRSVFFANGQKMFGLLQLMEDDRRVDDRF